MAAFLRSSSFTVFQDACSPPRPTLQRAATFALASVTTNRVKTVTNATANNEKENIDPLTGLVPSISQVKGKKARPVKLSSRSAVSVDSKTKSSHEPERAQGLRLRATPIRAQSSPCVASSPLSVKSNSTTTTPKITKPKRRLSYAPNTVFKLATVPEFIDDDTVTGRIVRSRANETEGDRAARRLTVLPLADLSDAYALPKRPALLPAFSEPIVEDDGDVIMSTPVPAIDLRNALLGLTSAPAAKEDETASDNSSTPSRTRGVKRAFNDDDALESFVFSTFNSASSTEDENNGRSLRPVKRKKMISVPSTMVDEVPRAPNNTPERQRRVLGSLRSRTAEPTTPTRPARTLTRAATTSSIVPGSSPRSSVLDILGQCL